MLTKVELTHVPADLNIYIALYKDVKNAAFLREQLVNANSEFEFAFIDAKSVSPKPKSFVGMVLIGGDLIANTRSGCYIPSSQ